MLTPWVARGSGDRQAVLDDLCGCGLVGGVGTGNVVPALGG